MKNRKTRLISVILAATLLLTSCSNDSPADQTSGSTTTTTGTTSQTTTTTTTQPVTTTTTTGSTTTSETTTATTTPETTTTTTSATTTPPATTTTTQPPNNIPKGVVELSHGSGIYKSEFSLTMSAASGSTIYYTTDGSDPTESDTVKTYTSPIKITDRKNDKNVVSAVDPLLFCGSFNNPNSSRNNFTCSITAPKNSDVDKCTVIRACVKNSDGSFGKEVSSTYFIGTTEEHIEGLKESCKAAGQSLSVISIQMDYDDLFDSKTGIYVKGDKFDEALEQYLKENRRIRDGETARSLDANYKQKGREWEREAYVSFMEFDANGADEVLSQLCGIRIQGNYSRSDLQKGFRLYARSDYGENNFDYPFFGTDYLNDKGKVMDKFKTLVLRAGGNCAFTCKYNDTYWQSLVEEADCETQKSRPCVVYLNGEYWGLYILQEDYTDDYFEDLHGVEKDDVVVYKGDAEALALGYKLDEGEIPAGKSESYYFEDLLKFFNTHSDLKSDADYAAFCKLVDPESVRDYFAVQCWINNKWDWPGKNWSMWRTIKTDSSNEYADGRWRFMFYDVEFGGVSGGGDAGTNTIKEDNYKPNGLLDMDTNNPAVLCFAYLMTNEGFRNDFYDRLRGLSDGYFEKNAALKRLDEFEDIYSPLFDQFFERYEGAGDTDNALNGGYASSKCIRDFVSKRAKYIENMITYCEKILG